MNPEDIFNAITDIDDSLIEEAASFRFAKKRNLLPLYISAAAVLLIIIGAGFLKNTFFTSHMLSPGTIPYAQESSSIQENTETANGSAPEYSSGMLTGKDVTGEDINTSADNAEEETTVLSVEEPTTAEETSTIRRPITVSPAQSDHSNGNKKEIKPQVLSAAAYPEMAKYPNSLIQSGSWFESLYDKWSDDIREVSLLEIETDNVNTFTQRILTQFLTGNNDKNKAVSPLNIYSALGLLAECTDGKSRQQILSLLGMDTVEELRSQTEKLWRKNYRDDGYMKSILANSIWLNNSVEYNNQLIKTLSKNYYASVYYGTTGTDAYNKMLNNWIKEQTGGMLSPDMKMDEYAVFTIVSALLYQSKWTDEFQKSQNKKGIFNSPAGTEDCEFMTRVNDMHYYWGDNFGAVRLGLDIGGGMWFILPDEGVSADSIFADKQVTELLTKNSGSSEFVEVTMAVPKFDISVQTGLTEGLAALGITDVLNPAISDFSPLATNYRGIFVDEINHGMRIKIDEQGVSAATYTAIIGNGAAAPPDKKVNFTLDRPFAFAVTLDNQTILFAGVVNTLGS